MQAILVAIYRLSMMGHLMKGSILVTDSAISGILTIDHDIPPIICSGPMQAILVASYRLSMMGNLLKGSILVTDSAISGILTIDHDIPPIILSGGLRRF